MSVLIVVPTFETITTECYKALWELEDGGHGLMFDTVKGYDCALARISACRKAQDYKAEWLLMVDSDTILPPDALANMLEHDADFVLGYYQHKKSAPGGTCLWKDGDGGWGERYDAGELRALAEKGVNLVRVRGGGMGCTLLRVSVLDGLPFPWFKWEVTPMGTETGEDIYFCNLCRSHGVKIHADTRVACGHAYRTVHEV